MTNGNLTREKQSRHFEWNHSDHLREFRTQAPNGPATVRAVYLYDAAGMRVKKLVVKGNQPGAGVVETTTYIDEVFEYHQRMQAGVTKENSWLHVMDGESRVALVRVGQPLDEKDKGRNVRYCLGDHLGSSNLVVDKDRNWVNREEFTPYGETSFGGFGKKRYRFTGKERDEESGLNYHGARYYAPWLGRWSATDPKGISAGLNLYRYSRSNPIILLDPSGTEECHRSSNIAGIFHFNEGESVTGETESSQPKENSPNIYDEKGNIAPQKLKLLWALDQSLYRKAARKHGLKETLNTPGEGDIKDTSAFYEGYVDYGSALIPIGGAAKSTATLITSNAATKSSRFFWRTGARRVWTWGFRKIPEKQAEAAYDAIRASKTDVSAISRYTKIAKSRIQKIKEHLFNNPKFEADEEIAAAWHRLRTSRHTANDILLLKHEIAEIWFMRFKGISQAAAHRAANKKFNWQSTL